MAIPFVVLNDDVIKQRVLADARVLAEFPMAVNFRQELAKLEKECTSCAGKEAARKNLQDLMQRIRIWIAQMSSTDKMTIRVVLGVPADRKAMVSYFHGDGPGKQLKRIDF